MSHVYFEQSPVLLPPTLSASLKEEGVTNPKEDRHTNLLLFGSRKKNFRSSPHILTSSLLAPQARNLAQLKAKGCSLDSKRYCENLTLERIRCAAANTCNRSSRCNRPNSFVPNCFQDTYHLTTAEDTIAPVVTAAEKRASEDVVAKHRSRRLVRSQRPSALPHVLGSSRPSCLGYQPRQSHPQSSVTVVSALSQQPETPLPHAMPLSTLPGGGKTPQLGFAKYPTPGGMHSHLDHRSRDDRTLRITTSRTFLQLEKTQKVPCGGKGEAVFLTARRPLDGVAFAATPSSLFALSKKKQDPQQFDSRPAEEKQVLPQRLMASDRLVATCYNRQAISVGAQSTAVGMKTAIVDNEKAADVECRGRWGSFSTADTAGNATENVTEDGTEDGAQRKSWTSVLEKSKELFSSNARFPKLVKDNSSISKSDVVKKVAQPKTVVNHLQLPRDSRELMWKINQDKKPLKARANVDPFKSSEPSAGAIVPSGPVATVDPLKTPQSLKIAEPSTIAEPFRTAQAGIFGLGGNEDCAGAPAPSWRILRSRPASGMREFSPCKARVPNLLVGCNVVPPGQPNISYTFTKIIQKAIYGAVFCASEDVCENSNENPRQRSAWKHRRHVALKVMSRHLVEQHKKETEEDVAAEINFYNVLSGHKNILTYDLWWEDRGVIFLVFPLAVFGDLYDAMRGRNTPLVESEGRWLFSQLLSAAAYCQNNDVAFRDHSLENVLLFRDPADPTCVLPMITDPGQAVRFTRNYRTNQPDQIKPDKLFGKMFRPPEAYLKRHYDPTKVDVFCLGWMLFFSLTKRQAFSRALLSDPEWCLLATRDFTKFLDRTKCSFLSPTVRDLLWQMLEPDPTKRFSLSQCINHPWFQGNYKPLTIHTFPKSSRVFPAEISEPNNNNGNNNSHVYCLPSNAQRNWDSEDNPTQWQHLIGLSRGTNCRLLDTSRCFGGGDSRRNRLPPLCSNLSSCSSSSSFSHP